ncbi:MAG TPA: trypsin-like peptidase domain-containing protein [Anaerolineae bacterium]
MQEDKLRAIQRLPLRFAQPITVEVNPATHGTWDQLDANTRRWRLRIISADARSLNLGFSRFVMPPGGRLVIYTPDYEQIIGPFTSEDNESHGQLWTPLLASDDIIIEVRVPAEAASQLELGLSSVNYGYAEFGQAAPDKSGFCNIDVICPAGDNWRDEIRSAARYTVSGSVICSGSLVNNTTQDLTPYFLTANHCDGGISAANAPSMVVYWNYETSICGGTPDGSLTQFTTGAIFRAAYSASDFALVELDDPIDAAFNVYWAGWDNSSSDPINATTIHHPSGDEKRISFENDPTTTTSYLNMAVPGDGSHLRIADWDSGTTEPGSSGSPLFNQNKLMVGQLHGGYAACGNDSSDWYGRLSVSWAGGGTADSRLSDWLDPGNIGITALNGTDVLNVTPASLNVCVPADAIYTRSAGLPLGLLMSKRSVETLPGPMVSGEKDFEKVGGDWAYTGRVRINSR